MGVIFTEGRGLPPEFRRGSGYEGYGNDTSDSLNALANIVQKASPWDMITGIFVTKPAQERAAQVEITRLQAESMASSQAMKGQNLKTIMMYGAGAVGLLALLLVLTKRRSPSVAGYRRRRRRSRR